jgi:hypothetical protein
MNKGIALGLLIVGVVLLIWGADASGSFSSGVSRTFNGAPTDKTIWLIGSGIVVTLGGLAGLFTASRAP